MSSIKQSEAVVAAVLSVCGKQEGAYSPTTEQLEQIRLIVLEGFKSGKVRLSPDKVILGDKYLETYVPSLVNNHLRKHKALNGGVDYEAKNPGSRPTDEVLKTLNALFSSAQTEEDKAMLMLEINSRKSELKAQKAPKVKEINWDLLPESIRAKFQK